jgi:hypothetical protein
VLKNLGLKEEPKTLYRVPVGVLPDFLKWWYTRPKQKPQ